MEFQPGLFIRNLKQEALLQFEEHIVGVNKVTYIIRAYSVYEYVCIYIYVNTVSIYIYIRGTNKLGLWWSDELRLAWVNS